MDALKTVVKLVLTLGGALCLGSQAGSLQKDLWYKGYPNASKPFGVMKKFFDEKVPQGVQSAVHDGAEKAKEVVQQLNQDAGKVSNTTVLPQQARALRKQAQEPYRFPNPWIVLSDEPQWLYGGAVVGSFVLSPFDTNMKLEEREQAIQPSSTARWSKGRYTGVVSAIRYDGSLDVKFTTWGTENGDRAVGVPQKLVFPDTFMKQAEKQLRSPAGQNQ